MLGAVAAAGECSWTGAIARVTGIDGPIDDAALTLCRHELLRPRHPSTLPGHAEYEMRHALVRDVVYGT